MRGKDFNHLPPSLTAAAFGGESAAGWFKLYSSRKRECGLPVTGADGRIIGGGLKQLVETHGATDEDMHGVIAMLLSCELAGYYPGSPLSHYRRMLDARTHEDG